MMTATDWATRIRALRTALGLTVDGLAARLTVTPRTVARWESGETEPAKYLRRKIKSLEKRARKEGKGDSA